MLIKAILAALLAIVGYRILYIIYLLDFHKGSVVYNQEPGPCRIIPGIEKGAEDIEVLKDGRAFISSELLMELYGKSSTDPSQVPPNIKGRIYQFDFNDAKSNPRELDLIGDLDKDNFFPHGLSYWENKNTGELRLFVVNHFLNHSSSIMIFKYDDKKDSLHLIKSITDPLIHSPNDLVAMGPEQFYVTNDKPFGSETVKTLAGMFVLPWTNVIFYNGKKAVVSAQNFVAANGIALSPDLKYIYVNDVTMQKTSVFERAQNNSLIWLQDIEHQFSADNIHVDSSGDMWISGPPIKYKFLSHLKNKTNHCPSQVIRIRPGSTKAPYTNYEIRQVYMNDGRDISCSTVAVAYQNKMLIGSAMHKLVYCELKEF